MKHDDADELEIRSLLRGIESTDSVDLRAARDRTRSRMLAVFDDAIAADSDMPTAAPDERVVDVFDISGERRAPTRSRRAGQLMSVAAVSIFVVVVGVMLASRSSEPTITTGTAPAVAGNLTTIDASPVVPGLVFDIDPAVASVVRMDDGFLVIEIAEPTSAAPVELTILAVDRWAAEIVPESVPLGEPPDSLATWLGRSSLDLSDRVNFEWQFPLVVTDAWYSRWAVPPPCSGSSGCGAIAYSAAGDVVVLEEGNVNQLVSIDLPGAPTLLSHAVVPPDSESALVGGSILSTLRLR
jgi:hypothetical protein